MRDSNPRGLAPNPLSKSASRCLGLFARHVWDGAMTVRRMGEQGRTVATETRTETDVLYVQGGSMVDSDMNDVSTHGSIR